MKKIFKLISIGIGGILILIALALLLLATRMDDVAKTALEKRLSEVCMSDVTIESVRVNPVHQCLEIHRIALLNPPAFRAGPALKFERILVRFDLASLLSRQIMISTIALEGGDLYLRYELGEGTNLGMLAENAAHVANEEAGNAPSQELVVQELTCQPAHVHVSTNLVPFSSASMRLSKFKLPEVSEGKAITVPRTTSILLRSVIMEVVTLKGLLRPVGNLLKREIEDLI